MTTDNRPFFLFTDLDEFTQALFYFEMAQSNTVWSDLDPGERQLYRARAKGMLAIAARTRIEPPVRAEMTGKRIRVTRTIVYEGDETRVNQTLDNSLLSKECPELHGNHLSIKLLKEVREGLRLEHTTGKK